MEQFRKLMDEGARSPVVGEFDTAYFERLRARARDRARGRGKEK